MRENALGAYMGLIKQIDDQMGLLFKHLRDSGQMDDTVIVITSDPVTISAITGLVKRTCSMIRRSVSR